MTENSITADKVIVDHLFRPYCSGFNLLRLVTEAFSNVEVRRYNVLILDQQRLAELPRHVEAAVRAGEPSNFGGEFYVNGRLIPGNLQALENAIQQAGGMRRTDASTWHQPLPKLSTEAPGLLIRRITEEDVQGTGEQLPSFWCDLNAADPEVKQFLLRATQKYGCCMVGAYINGEACGFATFFPAEARELPFSQPVSDGTLRVGCMYVFPHRRRQGVATAILGEITAYARERGYRKIMARAGYADINSAIKGTPAGAMSVYKKMGFRIIKQREPAGVGDEGEAVVELALT
jgi:GNAT superfamily N-acetyltransferase